MSSIDLDRYFDRIGYQGGRDPTLETLRGVAFAQATSVPFENLNVLSGRGVQLDIPSLEEKIVHQRRGGYCFEQNGLALAALRQLGFDAIGLIGRVRWMLPDDHPTGSTHMVIRVELPEGTYFFDVGFGGMRLTSPLKFVTDAPQQTPLEDFRLLADGQGYMLQGDLGDRWANIYRFTLDPQTPADYDVSNWYTSTHPDSLFINHLLVEMPGDGVRRMIFNNSFSERRLGEELVIHEMSSVDELEELLSRHFSLTLRDGADRDAVRRFFEVPRASNDVR